MSGLALRQGAVLALALLVPSLFVMLAGKDPVATWGVLLGYTLGSWDGFSDVLVRAIPLTLLGLGVAVAFRGGIFNIGGEGQLIAGAVLAVAASPLLQGLGWFALPLYLLAGMLGGAAAGGVVGWLRTRYAANEIIVTILMNYVFLQLLTWVIRGPLQEPMGFLPRSFVIGDGLMLGLLDAGSRLHAGLFVAVAAAVVLQVFLTRSAFGFGLDVIGRSAEVARYAGIRPARLVVLGLLLSGALGGLAGAVEIAGVFHRLEDNFAAGLGLSAIAVALMAGLRPALIPFTAILFGIFHVGSGALQRQLSLPFPLVWIVQGVVILAFLAARAVQAQHGRRS